MVKFYNLYKFLYLSFLRDYGSNHKLNNCMCELCMFNHCRAPKQPYTVP